MSSHLKKNNNMLKRGGDEMGAGLHGHVLTRFVIHRDVNVSDLAKRKECSLNDIYRHFIGNTAWEGWWSNGDGGGE